MAAVGISGLFEVDPYDAELADVLALATRDSLLEYGINDEELGKKLSAAWVVALGKHVRGT